MGQLHPVPTSSRAAGFTETFKRISKVRALAIVRQLMHANPGSELATAATAAYTRIWGELPSALHVPHTPARKA